MISMLACVPDKPIREPQGDKPGKSIRNNINEAYEMWESSPSNQDKTYGQQHWRSSSNRGQSARR